MFGQDPYSIYNPYYPSVTPTATSTLYGKTEVVKVNGRNGAEAYKMAPNSSMLLLDESAPLVWLKMTDGAGYATLTPYKIQPYIEPTESDIKDDMKALQERIVRIEERLNEQSNIRNAEQRDANASKYRNDKTNDDRREK